MEGKRCRSGLKACHGELMKWHVGYRTLGLGASPPRRSVKKRGNVWVCSLCGVGYAIREKGRPFYLDILDSGWKRVESSPFRSQSFVSLLDDLASTDSFLVLSEGGFRVEGTRNRRGWYTAKEDPDERRV